MISSNTIPSTFKELLNFSPEAIILSDLQGRILFVNTAASVLWHATTPQASGKPISALIGNTPVLTEWEVLLSQIKQHKSEGKPYEVLNLKNSKLSSELILLENESYLLWKFQQFADTVESVQRSTALIDSIFINNTDAYLIIDVSTHLITECNKQAALLFECTTAEILGTTCNALLKDPFSTEALSKLQEEINTSKIERLTLAFETKKGKVFWGDITFSVIAIDEKVFHLVRIINVSDRVNAHTALENSEQKLRSLINYSQALICTHSIDGMLLSINPACVKAVEAESEQQLIGMNLSKLIDEKNLGLFQEYLRKVSTEIDVSGIMAVRSLKGKRLYWIYNNYKVEEAGKETYVVGVAQDITDRMMMEKELKSSNALAAASLQSRETFLAMMSHEMRTPLHGILGVTRLLHRTGIDDRQEDYLNMIENSADNLLLIINDLLDLSKIDSGKIVFDQIPFNVQETIQTITGPYRIRSEEKGISLIENYSALANAELIGDPIRLNQIILNLISNAIKFTDQGFVELVAESKQLNEDHVELIIKVRDTGIGIPEDKLNSIFDAFTQSHSDTEKKYGGTGLGLTIARRFALLQQGNLAVSSELSKGSTFTLTLPCRISHAPAIVPSSKNEIVADLSKVKILLGEDNELNQHITKLMLAEFNCIPDLASDGREAIALAEKKEYDLILMDIHMPGIDGIEATKAIRQLEGKKSMVPIIALTANARRSDQELYLKAGLQASLAKPFKENDLIASICEVLTIPYEYRARTERK